MTDVPSILRTPKSIGARTTPNRFVAQPMEGNDGENGGRPSERTVKRYGNLGRGLWGIAVVEAVSVVGRLFGPGKSVNIGTAEFGCL